MMHFCAMCTFYGRLFRNRLLFVTPVTLAHGRLRLKVLSGVRAH